MFGSTTGACQPTIQTAWETLKLLANGIEPRPAKEDAEWNRQHLQRIDLRWHDLRHEGACRVLADGVDIRIIQLMLGHASIQQTQRYRNVTDEELRKDWRRAGSIRADHFGSRRKPEPVSILCRIVPDLSGRLKKWLAALDDFCNWLIREAA